MAEAVGAETPCDIVRRKARSLVDEATQMGWEGPPFDPEVIASFRSLEVRTATQSIRADGRIFPNREGTLIIELRPDLSPRRRRFTICHEIAHTLFPDCYESVRHRGAMELAHRELEFLCNLAAGEFLMPLEAFNSEIADRIPSMYLAQQLRVKFDASTEATLRRLIDVSGGKTALLTMSRRLKPSEIKEEDNLLCLEGLAERVVATPKLRVDYSWTSPSFRVHIPEHKSAPDGSVAYQVLESAGCLPKKENWGIRGQGDWMVEATTAPPVEGVVDRVLVLVRPV